MATATGLVLPRQVCPRLVRARHMRTRHMRPRLPPPLLVLALMLMMLLARAFAAPNGGAEVERGSDALRCSATGDKPSAWGHLYVQGLVEPLEFFTSLFSKPFPCEPVPLVLAEPRDACSELVNAEALRGAAVLVERGTCSFSSKADRIARAGARAVVVRNQVDNTLFAMPDSDVEWGTPSEHASISSVMIRERAYRLVKHHLDARPDAEVLLRGEFARDEQGLDLGRCGACESVDGATPHYPKVTRLTGGRVHLSADRAALDAGTAALSVDFFVGFTGSSLPVGRSAPLVVPAAGNEHGCDALAEPVPEGSVLLLQRGKCLFTDKQEVAVDAGARAVLVANSEAELVLPGVPQEQTDPFSIHYRDGTLLAMAIMLQRAGAAVLDMVRAESGPLYVRFEQTNLTIQSAKSGDEETVGDMLFWGPPHTLDLEHAAHFAAQMALAPALRKSLEAQLEL